MNTKLAVGIGVLAVAGLVAAFLVAGPSEVTPNPDQNGTTTTNNQDQTERVITAQHQYNASEGVHIVAGTLEVPTPCHLLDWDVELSGGENQDQLAKINFEVTKEDEDQMCAQVIEDRRFKATFQAPEDVRIEATYNGNDAQLNLVDVPEGENLEEFEVYIKG